MHQRSKPNPPAVEPLLMTASVDEEDARRMQALADECFARFLFLVVLLSPQATRRDIEDYLDFLDANEVFPDAE